MFIEAGRVAKGAFNAGPGSFLPATPVVSFSGLVPQIVLNADTSSSLTVNGLISNLIIGTASVQWTLDGSAVEHLSPGQPLTGTLNFTPSSPIQPINISFAPTSPTELSKILHVQFSNPIGCQLFANGSANILVKPPVGSGGPQLIVNDDTAIVVKNSTGNVINVLANDSPSIGVIIDSIAAPAQGSLRISNDQRSLIYDAPGSLFTNILANYTATLLSTGARLTGILRITVEDVFAATGGIQFEANTNTTIILNLLTFITPAGQVEILSSPAPTISSGSINVISSGGALQLLTPSSGGTLNGTARVRHKRTLQTLDVNFTVLVSQIIIADELPQPDRVITVDTLAEFNSVVDAASGQFGTGIDVQGSDRNAPLRAGDLLLVDAPSATPITVTGTVNLSRSGTTPTNANRRGKPIIIAARNLFGLRFTGTVNITGTNVWLYKADLVATGIRATVSNHSMFFRCRMRGGRTPVGKDGGGDIFLSIRGNYPKLWYCEFTDFEGRAVSSVSVGGDAVRYPHIYRCHFHDNATPPPTSDGNARECIQFGQTQGNGTPVRTEIKGLVEECLFQDLYLPDADHDESEPISNKSSGNKYLRNTYKNVRGWLTLRFANDCEAIANYFDASAKGIICYGDNNKLIGNFIEAGIGNYRIFAGTQTMDLVDASTGKQEPPHPNGPTAPNAGNTYGYTPWGGKALPDKADEPVARNPFISGNTGPLNLGEMPRTHAILRVIGAIIEQHTGTIKTERDYTATWGGRAHSVQGSTDYREWGAIYRAAATVPIPSYQILSASDVGPNGTWVPPANYPTSL